MPIQIGDQLGSHEVTALLGKGGMGEVYRARDTKLKREVAIKVLPDEFSRDSERLSRFQREAELLASLNHPNIAGIYDLQEAQGSRFLVLELVEGETLAERIARAPIPLDEALEIAKHICEALEAAHERGIIHRDLKPANVKITPDGTVKVLDFGLAKGMESKPTSALSHSPTLISAAATNAGVILGTAAYMSPEQAKGKTVGRRGDIWAFGCVLYEMLTGRQAFQGEDVTEILARVLEREPDWSLIPASVPKQIQKLLRLCLQKDVRKRRSDAADVRIDMEQAMSEPLDPAVLPAQVRRRDRLWMTVATVFLIAIGALSVPAIRYFRETAPPEIRVEVNTPTTFEPASFATSPDGKRLVFVATNEGKSQLWIRSLDSVAAKPLAATDGAFYPFWSPDSSSVGFFADTKLKRVDIVGGAVQVLANAVSGRGGAWNRDGFIVFAPSPAGPLRKVPAVGGESVALTRLESDQTNHRFPQFLPDGQHFIYFAQGPQLAYVGSLDGSPSRRLLNADGPAEVSFSGFLLFPRQGTLFAQAFDFGNLELSGNPFPVAEQLISDANLSPGFSTNSDIVAYRSGAAAATRQLTWLDRSGKMVGTVGAVDGSFLLDSELSPDGKHVAVIRASGANQDVWLIDVQRGVPTRFTFDALSDVRPVWSPDGNRVVFSSNRSGQYNLYTKASSGAGVEGLLLGSDELKVPHDWSPDGRFLLYHVSDSKMGMDLWILPISGDKKPYPFLKTPFEERDGQFSPDGKWIAYQSNESGQFEIYVQPFPGPGGKFQVSTNGGAQPRWNKNGKEIFYVSLDSKMMSAPIKLSPDGQSLEGSTPAVLFPVRIAGGPLPGVNKQQYAVSADGQRFLVNLDVGEGTTSPITLIYHWKPPRNSQSD
jgi:eukaryotic-like serine/threonine-protein kinase